MFTYFATCEDDGDLRKELIRVAQKTDVFAETKRVFGIAADVEISVDDTTFKDAGDLDWLPDRAKIVVRSVKQKSSDGAHNGDDMTTQPEDDDGVPDSHSVKHILPSEESAPPSTSGARRSSVSSVATVPVDEMDLSLNDDPPDVSGRSCDCGGGVKMDVTQLSSRLRIALGRSDLLRPQLWQEFIQAVFDQKIIDVFYPSKRSYAEVSIGLIDQFREPVMEFPSCLFDSVEALKKRLRTKLKNERYRSRDEDLDLEREAKKLRRVSADQARRGLPHYLATTTPPSEAVVTAMRQLKQDASCANAASLKKTSFDERRRLIVSCRLPITRIQEKCPWLFNHDEVWEEFVKVTGKPDARTAAEGRWKQLLASVKDVAEGDSSDDEAVEILCNLLGTDLCRLVGPDAQQPSLVKDESFAMMVEDVVVAKAETLSGAVLLWAIAHIVFAQPVPRSERRKLYIFVQNFVLRVSDNTLVPKLCWSVAKRYKLQVE